MITQGNLEYQVIGNPPDEYTRIWLRNVNRHFFDAFPAKHTSHHDSQTGQTYFIKKFKRRNTEVWLTCYELDMNGRRDGVDEPDRNIDETHALLVPSLFISVVCASCQETVEVSPNSISALECPNCGATPLTYTTLS